MEFNFKKEIYTTPELLKEVSIARAVFFRYQKDWIVKGRCPTEMGNYTLTGSKRSYWLIRKFMGWLIQYQVNEKKTFNNEVRDQEIAIGVLKRFKNEQK